MANFEVIVGNIGSVHEGGNERKARKHYDAYVLLSILGYGRASGERVTLLKDGEIISEHY
jgi:hypothetical protein